MNWIIQNLDLLNFTVAVVALLLAVYSIWYTHKQNRYSLEIDNCGYITHSKNYPPQLNFDVINNSPAGIRIQKIELSVDPIDFDLDQNRTYSHFHGQSIVNRYEGEEATPFSQPIFMEPHSRTSFSYYLRDKAETITIKLVSDKNLKWYSKSISITVYVFDFD